MLRVSTPAHHTGETALMWRVLLKQNKPCLSTAMPHRKTPYTVVLWLGHKAKAKEEVCFQNLSGRDLITFGERVDDSILLLR